MDELKIEIEFLKISARAFKLALLYSKNPKTDYINTLKTYLSVPNIDNELKRLIHEELEFFNQY